MARTKALFLQTLNKPAVSLSPDDMKVAAKDWVADRGLDALTRSQQGTGQRAPMPKPRRQQFQQNYWKNSLQHPDNTLGDVHGLNPRRELTTGGRI